MELLPNNSFVNDSHAIDFINNTNTHAANFDEYWLFVATGGPIAVVIFIAVCVYFYSKIILICYKGNNEQQKITIKNIKNPIFIEEVNSILLEETICCICLDNVNNEQSFVSLNCGHVFHRKCLETWVKTQQENEFNSNCPLCRESILKIN